MAEPSTDPEPDQSEMSEATATVAASPADAAGPADRRAFLRQLSTDAVWTAGKVAGASAAFRRSIVAAGGSAIGAFDTSAEPGVAAAPPPAAAAPPPASPPTAPPAEPARSTPAPSQPPDPVAALSPEQHLFLRSATKAALAVNDPAGPPLLAFSIYHWDGEVIWLPARDFTARTTNIDLDRRVGLLIDDPASEAWVAINGTASLVYGDPVEREMRQILEKYHEGEEATRRWLELSSTGDQVVIRIRPTRFVWRSA